MPAGVEQCRYEHKNFQHCQCDRNEINDLKCALIDQNLFAEKIEEKTFCNYKYYPDIPGNALSWGTINKHLMGMLIIRPASNRKLMWHGLTKPWIHYVPCCSDFSDLMKNKLVEAS